MSEINSVQQIALDVIANGEEWHNDVKAAFAYVNQHPAVGMPATFYSGSDCYAYEVAEIVYFKSGAKAGEPKAIIGVRKNGSIQTFTRTKNGYQKKYGDHFGGSFRVGKAKEYRDPSF